MNVCHLSWRVKTEFPSMNRCWIVKNRPKRMATCDKMRIFYSNIKGKRPWSKSSSSAKTFSKLGLTDRRLCPMFGGIGRESFTISCFRTTKLFIRPSERRVQLWPSGYFGWSKLASIEACGNSLSQIFSNERGLTILISKWRKNYREKRCIFVLNKSDNYFLSDYFLLDSVNIYLC